MIKAVIIDDEQKLCVGDARMVVKDLLSDGTNSCHV
jgi:uncharacterized protein YodC (DUF2158 family)